MNKNPNTNNHENFCINAPKTFCFCLCSDCTATQNCLRALAAKDLDETRETLYIVNPKLINKERGTSCRFYRSNEMIKIAYGFKKNLAQIESGKIGNVRSSLSNLMCQRNYYYYLNGEKPISPKLQQTITSILIQNGAVEPVEFDRYEWQYEW